MGSTENLKKKLINDTFWGFITIVINRVGTLFLTIFLARSLLPESYGLYSLVLSTALLFYILADLGINKAFIRYLSHSFANKKKHLKSYYNYFKKLKLIMSLAASILLLLFSWPLANNFFKNPGLFYPLIFSAIYIFIFTFEEFYAQVFFVVEKIKYSAVKEFLNFLLRALFIMITFSLISESFQISSLFIGFSIAVLLVFLYNFYFSKKLVPEFKNGNEGEIDKKRILSFVGYLSIASISAALFAHVDSIMLGRFLGPEFVGYYRAGFSFVFGILGFVAFPNVFLLPVFTKLEKSNTEKVFAHAFRYMTLVTVPITVGLILVGKYFIATLYGSAYLPGVDSLYILSLLIFPAMGVGLFLSLFSSKEQPQIFANLIVITGILNIILNIVLIKYLSTYSLSLGVLGASIATTVSWYFYFFMVLFAARKKLKYSLKFPGLLKPIFASGVMGLSLLALFRNVTTMTFPLSLLEIILGVIIYCGVMVLIGGLTQKDLEIIKLGFNKK